MPFSTKVGLTLLIVLSSCMLYWAVGQINEQARTGVQERMQAVFDSQFSEQKHHEELERAFFKGERRPELANPEEVERAYKLGIEMKKILRQE
ncbi:hypothetical protein A3B18_02840 [Candidatus Giovannonibacteria bacterium RIFCSPLOWO2_01_FULL_46_13]|uniref:Uncharacterized protein n=1 Tax=Candidatus Giovannonibacteria bacterium RIFCSPLOWO2_01_FULL_46_13 TaxID=1798352 RepID=A0A1F5X2W0_9BACT|nr:MAG: hypothetical protein A3B18_02840 [Candidatus Giovannonibacteria bacterium RIFCSPLOWO2_01_FULL_46_13]